ncbi:MAG: hypothetical protein OXH06_15240 [Gemmatimonadetes bacterium]|nr:hypothetical protein [Gemmatimonadota bacterium]
MALPKPQETSVESQAGHRDRGITLRAVGMGVLVSALSSGWVAYSRTAADTSSVNITHLPVSFFGVFLVVLTINLILRSRPGPSGLGPSEMLTIFAMGLVAAMVPARGLTGIWLGLMAVPYYRSTPENGWIDYVQPYLPDYLFPTNDGNQTTLLYEGLPGGAAIPWNVWYLPLFWWLTLILAGFTVCACITVILRRQWVEYERLDYPLLAPILETIDDVHDASGRKKWPDYFKGRLFWIGFGIAFGIIGWNMISYFQPTWPRISMSPNKGLFYFARIFPPLLTHINTYTIGFGYFVKLEILFSIWFFHFLLMSEIALIRKTGFQFGRMHQSGGGWGDPLVQWQSLGALFVFVAWGFWAARHHLRDVFRKAFFNECGVDDSREMLSYRTAVIGFIAGNLYIVAWLHQAGIELALLAITVPASIIIYIALARFVCESGTLYLGLPTSPLDMGYQILGTETISARVLTASATSHALRWMYFMPALSQGAKAIDRVKGNRRVLFWAVLGGLLTALAVNIWMVLYLGYKYGAFNFTEYPFTRYAPRLYDAVVANIKSPEPASWERLVLFAFGGILMAAFTLLRYRLPWWPLHPVGFIVTTTSLLHEITAILIVWLFKAIVMRVGGVQLYRYFLPLFFGIIVGRATGVLVSFIVDLIWFPGGGHHVHGWA